MRYLDGSFTDNLKEYPTQYISVGNINPFRLTEKLRKEFDYDFEVNVRQDLDYLRPFVS